MTVQNAIMETEQRLVGGDQKKGKICGPLLKKWEKYTNCNKKMDTYET